MTIKFISIAFMTLSVSINAIYFFSYIYNPLIRKVYTYWYVGLYVSLPVFILSTILVTYVYIKEKRNGIFNTQLFGFYWFYVCVTVGILIFFQRKEKDLNVVIKNCSSSSISRIEVFTRNNQFVVKDNFEEKNKFEFNCKCRDISFSDSVGVTLFLKNQDSEIKINVLSNNEPIYDEDLVVIILSDSEVYKSVQKGRYYQSLKTYGPLVSYKNIECAETPR